MFQQPLTFFNNVQVNDARMRQFAFRDSVLAGVKHLVLNHEFMMAFLGNPNLIPVVQKEMADAGLDFVDSHAVFGRYSDLNCPNPDLFPVMLQMHKAEMEICAMLGVKTICIHTGNNAWPQTGGYCPAPDAEISHCLDRIRRGLDTLLPEAERLGVVIGIENVWFETNTPEHLLEIKRDFPTPALGFCYDSGHAHLMRKDRGVEKCSPKNAWGAIGKQVPWDEHILDKLLDDVVICHLHGNDGITDLHRLPEDSDIDWNDICAKLHKAPRLQSLQSEVIPQQCCRTIHEVVKSFEKVLV